MLSLTLKRGLLLMFGLAIAGGVGVGLLIFAEIRSNALQLRPLLATAPKTPGFLKEWTPSCPLIPLPTEQSYPPIYP